MFSAYKYAFLVQITRELAEDVTFDLAQYLSEQVGVALANSAGAHFVTGTGSSADGCITGATLGVTGGAGVTGKFTADNLIDLYHSVAEPYARSDAAAWLMRNATLAEVRKLKDSSNRAPVRHQRPRRLRCLRNAAGAPGVRGPRRGRCGRCLRQVGPVRDFSRYWVRQVNGIRFDRSDDYAFGNDMVTFRATWRCDGQMVDTSGALKYFQARRLTRTVGGTPDLVAAHQPPTSERSHRASHHPRRSRPASRAS